MYAVPASLFICSKKAPCSFSNLPVSTVSPAALPSNLSLINFPITETVSLASLSNTFEFFDNKSS